MLSVNKSKTTKQAKNLAGGLSFNYFKLIINLNPENHNQASTESLALLNTSNLPINNILNKIQGSQK